MQNFSHPLLSLLPDVTDMPVRRQVVGALIASVVLHLLALAGLVLAAGLLPTPKLSFAPPKAQPQELQLVLPEPEPLEMQIVRPEDFAQARAQRETIDSTGLAKSDDAPKDATFESDQDMKAASELPAKGDAPLPTTAGKERPFTNLTTQDVALGSPKLEPSAAADSKPQPAPREQTAPAPPAVAKSTASPAEPAEPAKPAPPLPEVKTPSADEIALAEKAKMPAFSQSRLAPPAPRPEPKQEMAKLETAPLRAQPGFRAQQEETRIEGSITNRGKAAVDANKTPIGVYKRQVNNAIGSRWYYYVRQRRDLIAFGSVKVSYSITADGKIVDVKVISNTSNETLANISQQSVREAEIGPPPEEAQASMNRGRLEFDLNFTYYDQH